MANRILIKNSTSGANVPATNEVVVSELGANTTDGKLYLGTDLAGAGHSDPGDDSTELSWIGAPIKDEDDMASDSDDSLATQQSIKAYVDNNGIFTQCMVHNYYTTSSGGLYIPFGGSQRSGTDAGSYSYNDDSILVAPYDGKITSLWLNNHYSSTVTPGAVACYLNTNDSDGAVMSGGIVTWAFNTVIEYSCSQNNTFSQGDLVAIKVDPAVAPRYVTITSVWEFTK